MRRSTAPLRVKNAEPSSIPRSRHSSGSGYGIGSSLGSRTSIGGRLSLTGGKRQMTRPSSIGLGGGPNKKSRRSSQVALSRDQMKDPRKVSDKGFKDKSIRDLVTFLAENGYPHPISPKILHTPTTKDFIKIFEYLVSFIDPKYKMGPKVEEEVPKILKQYGYPFTISKSAMFTIGSPHTWPTLLAALTWLRQQIQYALAVDIEDTLFASNDDYEFDNAVSQQKIVYDFCEKTYAQYLEGKDDFPELEEQFSKEMKKSCVGGNLDSLAAEHRRYTQELQVLSEHSDELSELKDRCTSMRLDSEKMQNYIKELDAKIQNLKMTEKNAENEVAASESEVGSLQSDNQKKQHIFETQEFSQADVQRINMERNQLQRQIATVEKETEDLDKSIWNEEMEYGKFQDSVAGRCAEYNKLAQLLQLVPSTAENAFGNDYEMRPTVNGTENENYISVIKPALTKIRSQCIEKFSEVSERKFNEQETLEQLSEMVSDKEEGVVQFEAQIKLVEESMETHKQSSGREHQILKDKSDELQLEVRTLKQQSCMSKPEAERLLNQDKLRFERSQKERNEDVQRNITFLKKACSIILDHKIKIQDHMEHVEKKFQTHLHKLQSGKD